MGLKQGWSDGVKGFALQIETFLRIFSLTWTEENPANFVTDCRPGPKECQSATRSFVTASFPTACSAECSGFLVNAFLKFGTLLP